MSIVETTLLVSEKLAHEMDILGDVRNNSHFMLLSMLRYDTYWLDDYCSNFQFLSYLHQENAERDFATSGTTLYHYYRFSRL